MTRVSLLLQSWQVLLLCCFAIQIATAQDCNYASPVKGPTLLSGSYGEPRTAHFHAGIDYKQRRGIPHDTILAVEEGYISRINIQPDGYGNGIYIDHPCGQTSVYGHLYELMPHIREYITDLMRKRKVYKIDINLKPSDLPVAKGQPIGIMGSTGRSSGPHLHFEIRNTKTEKSINPALLGFKPNDNIIPVIRGIVVYSLTPDGQELEKKYLPAFKSQEGVYTLKNSVIESGSLLVGVGIHTYDMMNGANNHNGIYSLDLRVDGDSQFRFKMDSISFDKSRFIHSHMDYEAKMNNKYIIKCFRNEGNPLQIYREKNEAGMISLYNFRPRKINLSVYDIEGNQAEIEFQIKMKERLEPLPMSNSSHLFRMKPSDSLLVRGKFTEVYIPTNAVSSPQYLSFTKDDMDHIDLLQSRDIPLFKYIKVKHLIASPNYPKEKYCFTKINDKGETQRYKARWESDTTLVAYFIDLDKYGVAVDTLAPRIQVVSLPKLGRRRGVITIKDNFTPVYNLDAIKFQVYLDDEWLLCQHDIKSNKIWWDMPQKVLNKKHHLKVVATDSANNQSILERSFDY